MPANSAADAFPLFLAAIDRALSDEQRRNDPELTAEVLELVRTHPERVAAQVRAWLKEPAGE